MAKREKSPYIKWVETLKCGNCIIQQTRTEAHHFKSDLYQSGMALRSNDQLAIPLCVDCHDSFHRANWGDDWRLRQRGILILTLIEAFDAGMIKLSDDLVPEW